jgi:hypothetical protein
MRVVRILIAATLSLGWAFAPSGENGITGKTVYFLKDDSHKQWCGYASESRFKSQIQALVARVVGGADYTGGRISRVRVTETDETDDWAVNDDYTISNNGKIKTLKRTINILPENNSEEQLFLIQNGKAIKQRSIFHALGMGKTPQKSVDWFKAPPVVTNIGAFPFSALIGSKRTEVWSKGDTCIRIEHP